MTGRVPARVNVRLLERRRLAAVGVATPPLQACLGKLPHLY